MKKNISAYSLSQTAHRMQFNLGACILAAVLFPSSAFGQVYKCTSMDETTRQNKVVYSDAPCGKAEKQTLTQIQVKSQVNPQSLQATQLAQAGALDSAVTRAVLSRDFKLAKSLAATKEHWRLIAIAEGESAPQPLPQPLIVANTQPVVSPAYACALAKDDFETTFSTTWRDKELVAAKKSVMNAACGVTEPEVNRPIFAGQTYSGLNYGGLNYGGLNAGRWPYRHHPPYQLRPHRGVGHHAYPQAHRTYNGRSQPWGGASLSYKSKHFGVNVNSTNVR